MSVSTTNFSDRLARIEQTRLRHAGTIALHVGDQEVYVRSLEALKPRESAGSRILHNILYPLSFVVAFAIGAISLPISVAIRARIVAYPGVEEAATGDAPLLLALALGMMTSFVLSQAFRLGSKELATAQAIGVWAAVCTLHNLAFWMPDLSALVFTPEWVNLQTHLATPDSFIFRGLVFQF